MKNADDNRFKEALGRGPSIPSPDPVARSRALSRALTALKHRETSAAKQERHRFVWLGRIGGIVAILLFLFAFSSRNPSPPGRMRALSDLVVLDEMSALFDRRLTALVERGGKMDIQLSPEEMPVSEQPISLVLSRGSDVLHVLSFSGREVRVSINGQAIRLDVLATKDGEVIVTGENFLWNRQNPASLAGYRINATMLTPSS